MNRAVKIRRDTSARFQLALILLIVGAPAVLSGQQQAPPAAAESTPAVSFVYDVASFWKFKPDGGPMSVSMRTEQDGLNAMHVRIKSIICLAYDVYDYQVSGGPNWMDSDLYDLHAKMDEATMVMLGKLSADDAREARKHMAQALLADRLKLAIHHETRQFPVFVLEVAKGGPKVQAKPGDEYSNGLAGMDGKPGGKGMMRMSSDPGGILITAQGLSMDRLAAQISVRFTPRLKTKPASRATTISRCVILPTMRAGGAQPFPRRRQCRVGRQFRDFHFHRAPGSVGLKLESKKAPLDVIVIDHI